MDEGSRALNDGLFSGCRGSRYSKGLWNRRIKGLYLEKWYLRTACYMPKERAICRARKLLYIEEKRVVEIDDTKPLPWVAAWQIQGVNQGRLSKRAHLGPAYASTGNKRPSRA